MNGKSLITTLVLLLLSSPAFGQFLRREGDFGDRIVGDISPAGEVDMFVSRAVKGSMVSVRLVPKGKTPYRATMFHDDGLQAGLTVMRPDDDFSNILQKERIPLLLLKQGRGLKTTKFQLEVTGHYRLLVSAATDDAENPFPGTYLLKAKVKIPRKRVLKRSYDEGLLAEVPIDLLPGSSVKAVLKPGRGSPLPEVVDFLDPAGNSALEGIEVEERKTSVRVKSGELTMFGTHVLQLRASALGSVTATVRIRPPKTEGRLIEHIDGGLPSDPPVTLSLANGEPIALIEGETGGANRLLTIPGYFNPNIRSLTAVVLGLPTGESLPLFTRGRLPAIPARIDGEPFISIGQENAGTNDFQFRPGGTEPEWTVLGSGHCTEPESASRSPAPTRATEPS
jgi:hypothetical protein